MKGCKVQKYSYSNSVREVVSRTYFLSVIIMDESKDLPSSAKLVTVWGTLSKLVHSIASPFLASIIAGSYAGFP